MLSTQSKSSKKMRRGEVLVAPEIPLDLQMEIVNRLPVKSLARFKCLSKFWYSFISSKGNLFPSPHPPRLFISLPQDHSHCGFGRYVCKNRRTPVLLSLSSTSKKSSTAAFDLDIMHLGMGGRNMASLRGLILYAACMSHPCIYNPTTGQRLTLPKINFSSGTEGYRAHYFLGYDPVLDQYKVVCSFVMFLENYGMHYGMHWVFVLEAGGSWNRIEFNQPHACTAPASSLCINGVIYYLSFCYDLRKYYVMSFNVFFEEFNIIQLPSAVAEHPVTDSLGLGLIDYGGKPCLFDYKHLGSSGSVNLWVLEDDAETWSMMSLVLQSCQLHLVPDNTFLKVIGTTQNGEVVLQPGMMSQPYYILYYDLNKNDLRRVDLRGISVHELMRVGIIGHKLTPDETVSSLALMDTGVNIMHLEI